MLDRLPPPPPATLARTKSARPLLAGLLLGVAGAAVGYGIAALFKSGSAERAESLSRGQGAMLFGLAIAGMFLVILVHELGHLLGGRLVGFRFALLIVGPVEVRRTASGVRWGINSSPALWGGLAASLPLDTSDLRRRTMALVAGGPIASLVFSALAGILWKGLGGGVLASAAAITAAASLAIGVITLIPARASGFFTDGARLVQLSRDDAAADSQVRLLTLTAMSMAGTRPQDWPRDILEGDVDAHADGLFRLALNGLRYYAAVDRNELDVAREHLAAVVSDLAETPPTLQPSWATEAVWFEGVVRRDAPAAAEWAELARRPGIVDAAAAPRIDAALAWSRGDAEAARKAAVEALKVLDRSLDPGSAAAIRDQLEGLVARAEASAGA